MKKITSMVGALAFLTLVASGCGEETFKLFWRSKVTKPEAKAFDAPNYRLSVVDTPTSSNSRIIVEVMKQKFWIESATRIRMQFKRFENGKTEPIPSSEQKKKMTRITGKTEWVPFEGKSVTFTVGSTGEEKQVTTDAEGRACYDVTDYSENWVEGKSLSVDVKATLQSVDDPDLWSKVKGKPPTALKAFKPEDREVVEAVSVPQRTLQSIFERR
jgi:hypothetical protein